MTSSRRTVTAVAAASAGLLCTGVGTAVVLTPGTGRSVRAQSVVTPTVVASPTTVATASPTSTTVVEQAKPAAPTAKAATTTPSLASARPAPSAASSSAETRTRRGARLLASLDFDVDALGWTVQWLPGRAGYLGLTDAATRTVSIYVRATHTDAQLRVTLAHELGHVYDLTYGSAASRASYLARRGVSSSTAWWPCAACSDYSSGAGDFAEVFAVYLAGSTDFRSTLAARPSAAEAAALVHVVGFGS
ncbi:MAG: hypothetical protein JWO22_446 [Frankiales bacterium]|nr:hypothetical protein [Frankiales bacterium]